MFSCSKIWQNIILIAYSELYMLTCRLSGIMTTWVTEMPFLKELCVSSLKSKINPIPFQVLNWQICRKPSDWLEKSSWEQSTPSLICLQGKRQGKVMQVLNWWTPRAKTTLCTYNQRAKAKSSMAQESQLLLLLLQWGMSLEDWLHDARVRPCITEGKHRMKHSLREHIRD